MSLDSDNGQVSVLTQPFKLPDDRLSVDIEASHGVPHVEAPEPAGDMVARSAPVTGDKPDTTIRWEDGDISWWTGREVSLRYTLRNASLDSYWLG